MPNEELFIRPALVNSYLGRSEKEIEHELGALIPLLETGLIQDEEFNYRKKQLLGLLPATSPVYQLYSIDEGNARESNNSNPIVYVDGQLNQSGNVSNFIGNASKKNKEIKLFISSTFRDMQDERDYLVKHIFPQIKQLCAERGLFFSEIDLR
jgi:hypothetical protein